MICWCDVVNCLPWGLKNLLAALRRSGCEREPAAPSQIELL